MLPYRYQPLQYDDSIRIIILHPSLNNLSPIICTLQHARLSDASLKYEALSYTWGDAVQQQAVYLHGGRRELLVRKNCHDALRRLRLGHRDRLLWIDAICINQEDLTERARQVRIMDVVFSVAFSVVVFLGEQSTDSRALFDELAAVDNLLGLGEMVLRPPPNDTIVQELEILFELPWLKRVWVLQEVCAKESVKIMYGSVSASFEALRDLSFGYRNYAVTRKPWPRALHWISQPPEEFSTPQFALWNRLYQSRGCLATDHRDKVFALKSLIGSGQAELDFLINYEKSVEECFTQVALFLLPVLGLLMLTAIRHPHEKDMPSWIPDWSQDLPLLYSFFQDEFLVEGRGESAACPGNLDQEERAERSFQYKREGNCLYLLVTGCQYARIVERSQEFRFNNIDDTARQMKKLFSSLINLRQFVDAEEINDDPTMSDKLGQEISDAISLINGSELFAYLTQWCIPSKSPFHDEAILYFFENLEQCRISLMDNGELVIVPGAVRCGDVVCIFLGAKSPCALRLVGKGDWTLVGGECFILTEDFRYAESRRWFDCDDYVMDNQNKVEDFRLQ